VRGRARWALWTIIAAGVLVRLVLAFATYGDGPDIRAVSLVGRALTSDPLHVYGHVNAGIVHQWPYPSAYFPWIAASVGLHDTVGLPFHGWIQVAPIVADAVIAWVVQDFLGRRGAGNPTRLAAAAAVALGPSFGIISGYQGQFDSVGILPALLALTLWERMEAGGRRALVAGGLIGLGGALKITPLVLLLALLPTVSSRREAVVLVAAAGSVVLVAMSPFLIAEPRAVFDSLGYAGLPGVGGLTLAAQPELAQNWLSDPPYAGANWIVGVLAGHAILVNGAVLVTVGALLLHRRVAPVPAAILLWLSLYVFGTGFFFQYMIWGLPFFLLGGHLAKAALLQAALVAPAVLFYMRPWADRGVAVPYAVIMIAVWATLTVALAISAWRLWTRPRGPDPAVA
jgi:hypothetical protein